MRYICLSTCLHITQQIPTYTCKLRRKAGDICLYTCCISAFLHACPSASLHARLFVCMSVCLSVAYLSLSISLAVLPPVYWCITQSTAIHPLCIRNPVRTRRRRRRRKDPALRRRWRAGWRHPPANHPWWTLWAGRVTLVRRLENRRRVRKGVPSNVWRYSTRCVGCAIS